MTILPLRANVITLFSEVGGIASSSPIQVALSNRKISPAASEYADEDMTFQEFRALHLDDFDTLALVRALSIVEVRAQNNSN